ncbi:MAG: hypothetical protein HY904_14010 [Deltaproteobacteria bacterium]|nr:hypothetical protein [Deltaproteobacteria bacterium]
MLRAPMLVLLLGVASTASAAPRCVEGPPPPPTRPGTSASGLPQLGTMMMAAGTGLGLVSGTGLLVGALGVWERAEDPVTRRMGLLAVGLAFSAGLVAAALVTFSGVAVWFFAWLPRPVDTRVRCPPPADAGGPSG